MLERGTVVRLKVTNPNTNLSHFWNEFDGRLGIILGPSSEYDGPNANDKTIYEVLVGTDKMSVLESSLEVV